MTNSHEADINYNGRIHSYILIWLIATAVEYHVYTCIVVIILETGRLKPVDHSVSKGSYMSLSMRNLYVYSMSESNQHLCGNWVDV